MGVFDPEPDEMWAIHFDVEADAQAEWVENYGWECRDCGTKWDPHLHRATKTDPAYVEQEECPLCGGPPCDA